MGFFKKAAQTVTRPVQSVPAKVLPVARKLPIVGKAVTPANAISSSVLGRARGGFGGVLSPINRGIAPARKVGRVLTTDKRNLLWLANPAFAPFADSRTRPYAVAGAVTGAAIASGGKSKPLTDQLLKKTSTPEEDVARTIPVDDVRAQGAGLKQGGAGGVGKVLVPVALFIGGALIMKGL
ncbi:MAG: hypothetical protein OEY09_10415 [Gammaproteobacteria bacterium]|nr:hypothetical protein [Gammaproteobacteria bacterium]